MIRTNKTRNLTIYILSICTIATLFTDNLQAEIVFLKDGSVKAGTIQSETDLEIHLEESTSGATPGNPIQTIVIPRSKILRVSYSASALVEKHIYRKDGTKIKGYVVSETTDFMVIRPVLNSIKEIKVYRSDIDIIAARPVNTAAKKPDPINDIQLQLGAGLLATGGNGDEITGSEKVTAADFPVGFKTSILYSRSRLPLQSITRYSRYLKAWGSMQFYTASKTFSLLNGASQADGSVTNFSLASGLATNLKVTKQITSVNRLGFGIEFNSITIDFDKDTSTVETTSGKSIDTTSSSSQALLVILQTGLDYKINRELHVNFMIDTSFALYDGTLAGNYGLSIGTGYRF